MEEMMRRVQVITVTVLALVLVVGKPGQAWSKAYALDPVAGDGQVLNYEQGLGTVYSTRPGSDVEVRPTVKSFDKRPTLAVRVINKTTYPLEIDISHIEVFTLEGERLEVIPLEKLEKEAKTRAGWATFGVALAGALTSAAASYNTSYGTYRSPYGTSTFTVRTYDPVAANIASANTNAAMAQVNSNLASRLADMDQNMLQRTTVAPGQVGGGLVTLSAPPKNSAGLRVRVTYAGDTHEMQFLLKR